MLVPHDSSLGFTGRRYHARPSGQRWCPGEPGTGAFCRYNCQVGRGSPWSLLWDQVLAHAMVQYGESWLVMVTLNDGWAWLIMVKSGSLVTDQCSECLIMGASTNHVCFQYPKLWKASISRAPPWTQRCWHVHYFEFFDFGDAIDACVVDSLMQFPWS